MLPAFRLLAKLKGLRGTAFDPFGYTAERREERALIREYEGLIDELLGGLAPPIIPLRSSWRRSPTTSAATAM
jgi:indolepyruvate ferredoxin oxidoreductase